MTIAEIREWELFSLLNSYLADHDLRQASWDDSLCDWISELTGANGMAIEIQGGNDAIEKHWGVLPQEEAVKGRWKLEFPLQRCGEQSRLILFGEGPELDTTRQMPAQVFCGAIDISLAGKIALDEERSQRVLAESLVEISRVLNSSLDLEKVLQQILGKLADFVPYDSANVMLLTDGQLFMHAATGYEDSAGPMDVSNISFVPSRTFMMEEVLEGNQPVILPDTKDLPNWVWVPCGRHIRCWMGVPLQVKGQVIGLFSIDKGIPNFFTARHAELAKAFAAHAALALNNARMFAQICETQEQLVGLSAQVIAAQEKERQKIAVELHDHAGQALLGLRAELQILKHYVLSDSDQAINQIKYMDGIVFETSRDLRQLAHDLRPPILTEMGLVPALEQYIDEFSRRMKMPATFEFQHDRQLARIPENIELICYRIVQEALTNLAKHAQANKVKITLDLTADQLVLSVIDDGVGFTPFAKKEVDGFGLIGIRERVTAVGGTLQIFSQPGRGTQITVEIPLDLSYAS
ncbi:MAG: GAF domain-containing sensor histidine kinase [Anaerolineaceae bacterium]|nr:GAF domain-containing sensor histidine kinase [Anaerolineaceae bacterium]